MAKKRELFNELMDGIEAMAQQRKGKITLRTHEVDELPPLEVDAEMIRNTRERLHLSRSVFARRLRVSTRTLENWEQGKAKPNAQAAALILMVRKYPDTLESITIKDEKGKTIIEIPLTLGVVGAALLPHIAAIGAVAALVSKMTIEVEKEEE